MIKLKPIRENLYQEQIIYRKIKEYYDDILFGFIDKVFKEDRFENDKIDKDGRHHDNLGRFTGKDISITGKELGEYSSMNELRRKAKTYYREHYQGKPIERDGLGIVNFSRKGMNETISGKSNDTKIRLIPAIGDIIRFGEIGEEQPLKHPRDDDIVSFIPVIADVKIGEEKYKVGVFLGKDSKGRIYYDMFINNASLPIDIVPDEALKANSLAYGYNITQNDLNVNIFVYPKTKIRLENAVDLRYYILQGYLRYRDGFFTIKRNLPNKVAMELEKLGAIYSRKRRGYYLKASKIPPYILQAAAMVNIRDQERLTKISDYLRGLTETEGFITSRVDFSPEVIKIGADLDKQFKTSMTGLEIPANMTEFQKSEIANNYTNNLNYYIKKWVPKEIQSLRKDLEPLTLAGYRAEALEEIIQKHKGVSERKAKFLARQETKLLVAQYRKNRFKEAGVTQYIWSTILDGKERDLHRDLNGRVFSWDEPPIIDARTGEKGAPGEAYNCRCIAIPVVETMRFAKG